MSHSSRPMNSMVLGRRWWWPLLSTRLQSSLWEGVGSYQKKVITLNINQTEYYHFKSQISSFSPILIEVVNIYKHIHYIDISVKNINHEIIHTGTPCSKIKPFHEYISHVISSLFLWYLLAINLHYPCKQISTFYLSSKIYISKYTLLSAFLWHNQTNNDTQPGTLEWSKHFPFTLQVLPWVIFWDQ